MKNYIFATLGIVTALILSSCTGLEKEYQEPKAPVLPVVEIPVNCTSWFDGCNNCFVEDGKIGGCTRKFCPQEIMQESTCLQYKEEISVVDPVEEPQVEPVEIPQVKKPSTPDPVEEPVVEILEPNEEPVEDIEPVVETSVEKQTEEILQFSIGSEYKDCVGVAPMKCLLVNGEYFYDHINGFEYEEGFEYVITVKKSLAFPGEEIPADVSMYKYDFVEMLDKSPINAGELVDPMVDVQGVTQGVPANCKTWYDGCNSCFVENGEIQGCTEMACFQLDTPKCIEFFEE